MSTTGGGSTPGVKQTRLTIPQVRLAIQRAQTASVDEHRRVAQHAVVVELAHSADDHDCVLTGELGPLADSLAVHRLGEGPRLRGISEHVAADGKFGNDDDLRAGAGGPADGVSGRRAVGRELADARSELTARDLHPGHLISGRDRHHRLRLVPNFGVRITSAAIVCANGTRAAGAVIEEADVATTRDRPALIRQDGKEKVTGGGRYTADLTAAGQLHAHFRYADHSRARILRIDTTRAEAVPGVFAIVTHEDVPDVLYGQLVQDRRLYAKEEVRFDHDVIAAVAALTPEIAQAAVELIEVEYEPLTPVVDPEAALADDAPLVHEHWSEYEGDDSLERHGNILGHSTIVRGDAAAAMADADVVVRSRYLADGAHGVPIEPRAILAEWNGDRVTIWSSTQTPYAARTGVATTLGIPESKVRVIVPLLGGGFGSKCDFHFEAHIAALARKAQRPVKLVFSRTEEFVAPDHRRESILIELETGARRDGTLVARRGRLVLDGGAYCGEGGFFAQLAAMHAVGPYIIETVDIDSKLVYTNNQPSGSIAPPRPRRPAGQWSSTWTSWRRRLSWTPSSCVGARSSRRAASAPPARSMDLSACVRRSNVRSR